MKTGLSYQKLAAGMPLRSCQWIRLPGKSRQRCSRICSAPVNGLYYRRKTMVSKRTAACLLWCLFLAAAPSVCQAQDTPQPDSRKPLLLFPATLAKSEPDPLLRSPDKKESGRLAEKSWILKFLEGVAIGAATHNTQRQNEGRPQTPTTASP